MPKHLPSPGRPHRPSQNEPEERWSALTEYLQDLHPVDPTDETLDRIWQRVLQDASEPELRRIVQQLKRLRAKEPDEAALNRIWQRVLTNSAEDEERSVSNPLQKLRSDEGNARPLGRLYKRVASCLYVPGLRPTRWSQQSALSAILVLLLLLLATVNNVTAAALPGTAFYPVKLAWEEVRWQLTISPESRARLALILADRRRTEAETLVTLGASPELVAETADKSFDYLGTTTSFVPAEEIVQRIHQWQLEVVRWPEVYKAPTTKVMTTRTEALEETALGTGEAEIANANIATETAVPPQEEESAPAVPVGESGHSPTPSGEPANVENADSSDPAEITASHQATPTQNPSIHHNRTPTVTQRPVVSSTPEVETLYAGTVTEPVEEASHTATMLPPTATPAPTRIESNEPAETSIAQAPASPTEQIPSPTPVPPTPIPPAETSVPQPEIPVRPTDIVELPNDTPAVETETPESIEVVVPTRRPETPTVTGTLTTTVRPTITVTLTTTPAITETLTATPTVTETLTPTLPILTPEVTATLTLTETTPAPVTLTESPTPSLPATMPETTPHATPTPSPVTTPFTPPVSASPEVTVTVEVYPDLPELRVPRPGTSTPEAYPVNSASPTNTVSPEPATMTPTGTVEPADEDDEEQYDEDRRDR